EASAGKNLIDVQGVSAQTVVNANGGDDIISVDSSPNQLPGNLLGITNPLTVDGGPGVNTLTVDDSTDSIGRFGTVTYNTVENCFALGGSLMYSNVSSLTLNLAGGNNVVTIASQTITSDMPVPPITANEVKSQVT